MPQFHACDAVMVMQANVDLTSNVSFEDLKKYILFEFVCIYRQYNLIYSIYCDKFYRDKD